MFCPNGFAPSALSVLVVPSSPWLLAIGYWLLAIGYWLCASRVVREALRDRKAREYPLHNSFARYLLRFGFITDYDAMA
jgi:hypothetical protein